MCTIFCAFLLILIHVGMNGWIQVSRRSVLFPVWSHTVVHYGCVVLIYILHVFPISPPLFIFLLFLSSFPLSPIRLPPPLPPFSFFSQSPFSPSVLFSFHPHPLPPFHPPPMHVLPLIYRQSGVVKRRKSYYTSLSWCPANGGPSHPS